MTLRADHGFTLIEMLVTLSVVAVLLALAAPSFRALTAEQAVKNTAQSLYATLVYARGQALKRNEPVYVVPNGGTAGDWDAGWLVTTDAGIDSVDCDAAATNADVLRVFCDIPRAIDFGGGAPAEVAYAGNGRSDPAAFVICRPSARARTVAVALGGSAAIRRSGSCS